MSESQKVDVRQYYSRQAQEHGAADTSTMLDTVVRTREVAAFLRFLGKAPSSTSRLRVLEIGCGNGLLLDAIHAAFPSRFELHGVDLNDEMVTLARQRNPGATIKVADVQHIPYDEGFFDIVLSERVIINVLEPEGQVRAYEEVARVLRSGGSMMAVEGFKAGLENLNRARADFLLPPIPEPPVNNWYTEERWQRFLAAGFREFLADEREGLSPWNFLSSHYFMTRFLHDALRPEGGKVRNTEFARFFAEALPPVGDYSPLRIAYLRRLDRLGE